MDIKKKSVDRAIAMLQASGARFHIEFEGVFFGESLAPETGCREIENPGVTDYVRGYLKNLKVGEVAIIPADAFQIGRVQSTAAACSQKSLGIEVTTCRSKDKQSVEVLRIS